jgi:hypothetical protein
LKEMKSMQKQAQQPPKTKEEKGPLVQIKLGAGRTGGVAGGVESGGGMKKGGFKKGGFKSAFGSADDEEQVEVKKEEDVGVGAVTSNLPHDEDSDFTDKEDDYDPRLPTGCMPGCKSRVRAAAG